MGAAFVRVLAPDGDFGSAWLRRSARGRGFGVRRRRREPIAQERRDSARVALRQTERTHGFEIRLPLRERAGDALREIDSNGEVAENDVAESEPYRRRKALGGVARARERRQFELRPMNAHELRAALE